MQLLANLLVAILASLQLPGGYALPACQGIDTKFIRGPRVTFLNASAVEVSWHDLVEHVECAEDFFVQYGWSPQGPHDRLLQDPNEWRTSPHLPTTTFSYIVTDLRPDLSFWYQVVATPLATIE